MHHSLFRSGHFPRHFCLNYRHYRLFYFLRFILFHEQNIRIIFQHFFSNRNIYSNLRSCSFFTVQAYWTMMKQNNLFHHIISQFNPCQICLKFFIHCLPDLLHLAFSTIRHSNCTISYSVVHRLLHWQMYWAWQTYMIERIREQIMQHKSDSITIYPDLKFFFSLFIIMKVNLIHAYQFAHRKNYFVQNLISSITRYFQLFRQRALSINS